MIDCLILFGASGDLSGRFLLPGLAELLDQGHLPERFRVVGASGADWDDDGFRAFAAARLDEHAEHVPQATRDKLVRSLRYLSADATDPAAIAGVLERAGDGPVAVYLALPQKLFGNALHALGRAGLPPGSRVVLEKPFGEDQQSARDLNDRIATALPGGEDGVFRVDHVLGMATTQNLLAMRVRDRVLGALWSREHIEEIAILWEETLALEGRAGFYDHAGALKDVLQNHMLQVLALVAMEPPPGLDPGEVRSRKLDALRAVRPLDADRLNRRTQRARYTAGRLADREIPSYVDEGGVDPNRETETFAELLLEVDTPRWAGTRFRLRAGKALSERRKGVYVRFHPSSAADAGADELQIGLDTPEEVRLRLSGAEPLALASRPVRTDLSAYAEVLRDALSGANGLSVSGEEAEEAWRIVDPVLDAWREGGIRMGEYAAGSAGPPPL